MRVLALMVLVSCSCLAYAGDPGTEERPQITVAVPGQVEGLKGRLITANAPPVTPQKEREGLPSFGKVIGGVLYLPVWALNKGLDLAAGTLNAGLQVTNIAAGTSIDVLESGSRGLKHSGEVIELGAERFADNTAAAVN